MWANDILSDINYELKEKEYQKKKEAKKLIEKIKEKNILDPKYHIKLKNSNIWNMTVEEKYDLVKFKNKMKRYSPRTKIQKDVISFASKDIPYIILDDEDNANKYVEASMYWNKKTVRITTIKKENITISFAYNKEMKCCIFRYLDKIIISTQSSFDNMLNELEGKELIVSKKEK